MRPQTQDLQAPQQIAKDAITILINLSIDREVLEFLASDKEFIVTLLSRVTVCQSCDSQSNLLSLTSALAEPKRAKCESSSDAVGESSEMGRLEVHNRA